MKNKNIKKLKNDTSKFLVELKKSIDVAIEEARLNADIDPSKELNFYLSSADAIVKAMKQFDKIRNEKKNFTGVPTRTFGVNGMINLFQKSAFTSGDIPHLNSDSILAQQIIYQNINTYIPNTFLSARKKRYLLKKADLVRGIGKLGFDGDNHIIVGMNLNIYGVDDFEKIENYTINIPSTTLRNVLYVLPKTDLPIIRHKDLKLEEQRMLQLGILNDKVKLYGSLIDLSDDNNSPHREKWNESEVDFRKDPKVQLVLAFITEIVWKLDANVVQINVENSMQEQGVVNELTDIEKFSEIEKKIPLQNND